MLTLVIGGSCSGKSAFAESLVAKSHIDNRYYIATMEALDNESKERVARHRASRAHLGFTTLEYPRDIDRAASQISANMPSIGLLECLSNLVAGEMFSKEAELFLYGEKDVDANSYIAKLSDKIYEDAKALSSSLDQLIIVSNNIFEDGNHYDKDTRLYMDVLALVNNRLLELADTGYEVVAGIAVKLK